MKFKEAPIGAVFDVRNGATPASENPAFWDGDISWVGPVDLGQLTVRHIEHGKRSITHAGYTSCGTQLVPPGTILLSTRAPIGHVAIASREICFNQGCRGLVPRNAICSDFAYWALLARIPQLEAAGQGTTFLELSRDKLKAARIPLPDLPVQKAIAKFLDRETTRIDQLIEKKQRMAEVLQEREEATFLGVITGQKSDGPKKASGVEWIGSIPGDWQALKVTQVARQETGHTPSRKVASFWVPEECVIPWFSLSDVWQIRQDGRVYVSETSEKISQIGMQNSAARLLPANTVILSRTASVGFPAILSIPMATTQDFVGWICSNRVRPKYLYYVLRAMKAEFRRLMMGSTHQTIYMPDIRSFRTPLPPILEQNQIVSELDENTSRFQSAAAKIKLSIDRLREFRSALITASVTGQIDVSTWGKQGTIDRRLDQIEEATSA